MFLIDLDDVVDRLEQIHKQIPYDYKDRVFILGIVSESEDLKRAFNKMSFEEIGKSLAADCNKGENEYWGHELLQVNATEISRIRERIHTVIFDIN